MVLDIPLDGSDSVHHTLDDNNGSLPGFHRIHSFLGAINSMLHLRLAVLYWLQMSTALSGKVIRLGLEETTVGRVVSPST
jgi:hypothetical protein